MVTRCAAGPGRRPAAARLASSRHGRPPVRAAVADGAGRGGRLGAVAADSESGPMASRDRDGQSQWRGAGFNNIKLKISRCLARPGANLGFKLPATCDRDRDGRCAAARATGPRPARGSEHCHRDGPVCHASVFEYPRPSAKVATRQAT